MSKGGSEDTLNYLLVSDDSYLKDNALRDLKSKLLKKELAEFNTSTFSGGVDPVSEIVGACGTMTFDASNRIVVIKNGEDMAGEDLSSVAVYLKKPAKNTSLIIQAAACILKNKAWQEIIKIIKPTILNAPMGEDLNKLIENEARKSGKLIQKDAVNLIREMVGGDDMGSLRNEMNKILLYTADKKEITPENVRMLANKVSQDAIFKLGDYITAKDTKKALDLIREMLVKNAKPHQIIGLLASHYRKKYFLNQRDEAKKKKLALIIDYLVDIDYDIKRSKISPEVALETTVVKLSS